MSHPADAFFTRKDFPRGIVAACKICKHYEVVKKEINPGRGWGMYQARYRFGIRNDGTHNPLMIRLTEQAGEIPGLTSRMPTAPGPGGFTMSLIGTLASVRSSASYITGG